jgi:hypothetical protein
MVVFNTQDGTVHKTLKFETSFDGMMHPITYLNKFVIWHENQLILHNVMEDS